MSEAQKFPFIAWVLMPSFKPVEVEIVSSYKAWGNSDPYYENAKRKVYQKSELFGSKDEAISVGRARLEEQEADLAKRAAGIAKKRAVLEKAEHQ